MRQETQPSRNQLHASPLEPLPPRHPRHERRLPHSTRRPADPLESGLSLLGMGIQAPRPSWGLMLAEGRDYLSNAWWLATAPGLMISIVVLGANLLGDGLRDLLDPHLS